jgi:DNA-binding MurR/RpiR family transcriptional regulator
MTGEMEDQKAKLPRFSSTLRKIARGRESSRQMIFTGSGDSYACALFAHYLSGGSALSADPYELLQVSGMCKDKTVFIISITGRTRANLDLARRIKGKAKNRIAITANPDSSLVRECDSNIILPYTRERGMNTPGTLSFTLSLLAVSSRIVPLPNLRDLDAMNSRAEKWARNQNISPSEELLFIGSGMSFALSAYGAFKIHEVLGQPAEFDHTEQVGHSKLFTLRTIDKMICLALREEDKTAQLSRTLAKNGLRSQLLTIHEHNPVLAGLEAAFHFQHLALSLAKRRGLRQVAFLSDKKRLRLSSRLIY